MLLYLLFKLVLYTLPLSLNLFGPRFVRVDPIFELCCNLDQSVPPHKSSRGLKYVLCWQYDDSEFGSTSTDCAVHVFVRALVGCPIDDLICDFFDQFHCCIQRV